jgi:F420-dependent oxidoreductase-like protein
VRIGVMFGGRRGEGGLDDLVARARDVDARGFASLWLPQVFGFDGPTAAAVLGRETERIEIGTAVVPTQPRHPTALAQQALTAGVACDGRFTLGVGLSHPPLVEGVLGLSYARRAKHMREYVEVLAPLLRGEPARFAGEEFRVDLALDVPGARPVRLLVAALGDHMLRIAGRRADGTILWMTGPRTIESHVVPKLRAAAAEAGRPAPRVVAGFHVVLTADPEATRERLRRGLTMYGRLPSYRAMLDREGVDDPVELAFVGDERALDAALGRLRDVGVTDLEAVVMRADDGSDARTLDYLASRLDAFGAA